MTEGKIIGFYMALRGRPLRFLIRRKVSYSREILALYRCDTLREMITDVLTVLNPTHPDFMTRLQQLDDEEHQNSRHRSRRYIADRRDLLYINSPPLTEKFSIKVLDFWVATNINRKVANHIVWLACKAAGLQRENIAKLAL